jgi:hypothetical protein
MSLCLSGAINFSMENAFYFVKKIEKEIGENMFLNVKYF